MLSLTVGILLNQGNELLHDIFDFVSQAEKRKTVSTKEKVCHQRILKSIQDHCVFCPRVLYGQN
jgi:hypothetical protein